MRKKSWSEGGPFLLQFPEKEGESTILRKEAALCTFKRGDLS